MELGPDKRTTVSAAVVGLSVGAVFAGAATAMPLFFIAAIIVTLTYLAARTYLWLNDGWVKNSELEKARDRAMGMYLSPPGRLNAFWKSWAEDYLAQFPDDFPGERNAAVGMYLYEEHDADEMDRLLTERIWPRPGYRTSCVCERDDRRPWVINHVDTCVFSPNYIDPSQRCTCIKKRRKGKVKKYKAKSCPLHGWKDEADDDRDIAMADGYCDEVQDLYHDHYVEIMSGDGSIYRLPSHPLGPPAIRPATHYYQDDC